MHTADSFTRTTTRPTLARNRPCPSVDEVEDWLAEVRPTLASLRSQARPLTEGARRWVLDQADHARHAEVVVAHECSEAEASGRSCDALGWVHTKVCAVLEACQGVLALEELTAA